MQRIRLTMGDLGRVTVAEGRVAELAASLDALGGTPRSEFVARWRRRAAPRVPPSARSLVRLLAVLPSIPPDLLPDTCKLPGEGPLWSVLRTYYDACLADVWHRVQARKTAAVTEVTGNLASRGVIAALGSLGPGIRLRGDVLEIDSPRDRDLDLAGRGLRLVPSVFWQRPSLSVDAGLPTLVFPVDAAGPQGREGGRRDALETLMGRTRAEVLRATVGGSGTGEVARRLGMSAATVSEHAAALRHAGLLATARVGRGVRHTPTELGRQLLAE